VALRHVVFYRAERCKGLGAISKNIQFGDDIIYLSQTTGIN